MLLIADRLLKTFRTGFTGKAGRTYVFWGSFDLAVTSSLAAPLDTAVVSALAMVAEALEGAGKL